MGFYMPMISVYNLHISLLGAVFDKPLNMNNFLL